MKQSNEEEVNVSGETDAAAQLDEVAPYIGDDSLGDDLEYMDACADGRIRPIPLPWPSVAEGLGGGLWPGLHVLTGAAGEEKTQWAVQVAFHAARQGVPVLYVGLELGHADFIARLVSLLLAERNGRAPVWSDLYYGQVDNIAAIKAECEAEMMELPIRLEVGPPHGWSADLLNRRVKGFRKEHPETDGPESRPLLVVVDHLRAMASTSDECITQTALVARAVAREHGAAVLLLSSVAREHEKTLVEWRKKGVLGQSSKLHPADLLAKGSDDSELEDLANTVLALCRGDVSGERTGIHLALAKVRRGPSSWQKLSFNGGWFSDSTSPSSERGTP